MCCNTEQGGGGGAPVATYLLKTLHLSKLHQLVTVPCIENLSSSPMICSDFFERKIFQEEIRDGKSVTNSTDINFSRHWQRTWTPCLEAPVLGRSPDTGSSGGSWSRPQQSFSLDPSYRRGPGQPDIFVYHFWTFKTSVGVRKWNMNHIMILNQGPCEVVLVAQCIAMLKAYCFKHIIAFSTVLIAQPKK